MAGWRGCKAGREALTAPDALPPLSLPRHTLRSPLPPPPNTHTKPKKGRAVRDVGRERAKVPVEAQRRRRLPLPRARPRAPRAAAGVQAAALIERQMGGRAREGGVEARVSLLCFLKRRRRGGAGYFRAGGDQNFRAAYCVKSQAFFTGECAIFWQARLIARAAPLRTSAGVCVHFALRKRARLQPRRCLIEYFLATTFHCALPTAPNTRSNTHRRRADPLRSPLRPLRSGTRPRHQHRHTGE